MKYTHTTNRHIQQLGHYSLFKNIFFSGRKSQGWVLESGLIGSVQSKNLQKTHLYNFFFKPKKIKKTTNFDNWPQI